MANESANPNISEIQTKNGSVYDVAAKRFSGNRTIEFNGDVTANETGWDGSGKLEVSTTISDGSVGEGKIADSAVTNAKVADGAVNWDKIATSVKNGTIAGNYTEKLATCAQVKTYVDEAITGHGSYLGQKSVAEVNALTGMNNGDHVSVSNSGSIINPDSTSTSVIAGDNVIYDGTLRKWDCLAGDYKVKQEKKELENTDSTKTISKVTQNENGEVSVTYQTIGKVATAGTADKVNVGDTISGNIYKILASSSSGEQTILQDGSIRIVKNDSDGHVLQVGASNGAGNSGKGGLDISSTTSGGYTRLRSNATTSRVNNLPDKSGTIALTSDFDSYYTKTQVDEKNWLTATLLTNSDDLDNIHENYKVSYYRWEMASVPSHAPVERKACYMIVKTAHSSTYGATQEVHNIEDTIKYYVRVMFNGKWPDVWKTCYYEATDTYDSTSSRAISGKGVAEAIGNNNKRILPYGNGLNRNPSFGYKLFNVIFSTAQSASKVRLSGKIDVGTTGDTEHITFDLIVHNVNATEQNPSGIVLRSESDRIGSYVCKIAYKRPDSNDWTKGLDVYLIWSVDGKTSSSNHSHRWGITSYENVISVTIADENVSTAFDDSIVLATNRVNASISSGKDVGSSSVPVYVDANGQVNACNDDFLRDGEAYTKAEVNAKNWLVAKELVKGDDFDNAYPTSLNYGTISYYRNPSNNVPDNAPEANTAFFVESQRGNSETYITQKAYVIGGSTYYWTRVKQSGSWKPWKKVYYEATSTYSSTGTQAVNGTAVASALNASNVSAKACRDATTSNMWKKIVTISGEVKSNNINLTSNFTFLNTSYASTGKYELSFRDENGTGSIKYNNISINNGKLGSNFGLKVVVEKSNSTYTLDIYAYIANGNTYCGILLDNIKAWNYNGAISINVTTPSSSWVTTEPTGTISGKATFERKVFKSSVTGVGSNATGNAIPVYVDEFGEIKSITTENLRAGKDGSGNTITSTYATNTEVDEKNWLSAKKIENSDILSTFLTNDYKQRTRKLYTCDSPVVANGWPEASKTNLVVDFVDSNSWRVVAIVTGNQSEYYYVATRMLSWKKVYYVDPELTSTDIEDLWNEDSGTSTQSEE